MIRDFTCGGWEDECSNKKRCERVKKTWGSPDKGVSFLQDLKLLPDKYLLKKDVLHKSQIRDVKFSGFWNFCLQNFNSFTALSSNSPSLGVLYFEAREKISLGLWRSLKGREYPFKLAYRGVYNKPIVLLRSWVSLNFFFFWFVWWR